MTKPLSLAGRTGIVSGLANEHKIAFGCARALHAAGADLILSYGHPKVQPHVRSLAERLGNPPLTPGDVRKDDQLAAARNRA
jgi:enoyl-[acyl-carrier protein] reductase I